jgi:hypothetical protein
VQNSANARDRVNGKKSIGDQAARIAAQMSGAVAGLPSLGLVFPNLLHKLDVANRYRRSLESLESEHWPNPLFDSAMILLHKIVQVLAGSYSNTGAIISVYFSSVMARCDPA